MNPRSLLILVLFATAGTAPAQVFQKQDDRIKPSPSMTGDFYGEIYLDGNLGVFSSWGPFLGNGIADVVHHDGTQWVVDQTLSPWGSTARHFGQSSARDGNFIAIGAPYDNAVGTSSGAVYVFQFNGNRWVADQRLIPNDVFSIDEFGTCVALQGNTLVAGSRRRGHAYVYEHNGADWVLTHRLYPSDLDFLDEGMDNIDIDGNRIVFSYELKNPPLGWGTAYVFEYDGANWIEQQILQPWDRPSGDFFGTGIDIEGDVIAVGCSWDTQATKYGAVYVFRHDGTSWQPDQKLQHCDPVFFDQLGFDVALDGDTIVAGCMRTDVNDTDTGAAYVWRHDGNSWIQQRKLYAGNGKLDDGMGWSVAVDGDRVLVGAPPADVPKVDAGAIYEFDLSGVGPAAFDVWPDICNLGDPFTLTTAGGAPGNFALLYIVDVSGIPLLYKVDKGAFDAEGVWRRSAGVPMDNNLLGLDITFVAFHVEASGSIGVTNSDNLEIQ